MGGVSEDFVAWCESHQGCSLTGVELRDASSSSSSASASSASSQKNPSNDEKDGDGSAAAAVGAADAATRGRGVFAKVDFKKGERVLSIPYSACVGTAGLRTGAGRASRPPFTGATPAECLAWNLLSIRGDSEWAPYVAALYAY